MFWDIGRRAEISMVLALTLQGTLLVWYDY